MKPPACFREHMVELAAVARIDKADGVAELLRVSSVADGTFNMGVLVKDKERHAAVRDACLRKVLAAALGKMMKPPVEQQVYDQGVATLALLMASWKRLLSPLTKLEEDRPTDTLHSTLFKVDACKYILYLHTWGCVTSFTETRIYHPSLKHTFWQL